jgi:cardiolipin synthase
MPSTRDATRRRRGGGRLDAIAPPRNGGTLPADRERRASVRVAAGVALGTGLGAGLAGALWWARGPAEALRLFFWCLVGSAATAAISGAGAGLLGGGGGSAFRDGRVGVANALTIVRFALIAPTAWLLHSARYAEAVGLYGLLVATDVADGVVARRRREQSPFGVVMDPLADIASTFAVFTFLVIDNLVPLWLYLLLASRYAMLLVGSLVLSLAAGPIEFHATGPGKVVGVVQAAGAAWIMVAAAGGPVPAPADGPLFAFLGLGFASIVVSQAVIGWRHVRRAMPRRRGWQGGSSR